MRHRYACGVVAATPGIELLASYQESSEQSLASRIENSADASELMVRHVRDRTLCEQQFFGDSVKQNEHRLSPVLVAKGDVNHPAVVDAIIGLQPDMIVCFGASLIKSRLLSDFSGRFINVHLGLSPDYRGSGTNVWPLINGEPEYVGATFMHIDAGIDTGDIIHQIRARVVEGDTPHTIGNRLIMDMADMLAELVLTFDRLQPLKQPDKTAGRLYRRRDFDAAACAKLYEQFENGLVERYLRERDKRHAVAPILQNPALWRAAS